MRRLWVAAASACLFTLAACSSKLGTQSGSSQGDPGPLVVATPIGQKATSSAGADPVAITVRSGADVLLSGKDSQSRGSPLTGFAWTQAAGDPTPVNLIYRTSNTVDFTAPTVASTSVLNFTLTVQDANGKSASAHVAVTVVPASDPDQFLTAPVTAPSQRTFQVAVVPLNGLSNLQADTPVCIALDRTINYTNRSGQSASVTLARGPHDQVDAFWLQAAGGVAASPNASGPPDVTAGVASYTNPRATFVVPSLNDDDLFTLFNQPQGQYRPPQTEPASVASARTAQQLVPADINSASLTVTMSATPGTCATPATPDSSNPLIVSVVGSSLVAQGALAVSIDTLRQAVNGNAQFTETAATAAQYYKAIDPIGSAPRSGQTMNAWLDANCFNSTAANYGADTHAVYTNNFDLGFGRDMYFVTCTAKNLSATSVAAGRVAGDSASIVINYPSLEAVVLKQNPIIAVAMSHNAWSANTSAPPQGRFTKFFTFAPDDRDGNFYLVQSANFDHRGQKYMPGACTVCHGGTVNAANIASGDLDSAFMPWDESALLFADTDPAYTGVVVPKTGYTEADQTAAIYALNQHAYATYLNSAPAAQGRFAAPEALIQKWYGGGLAATPTPSNQGSFTFSDISFKSQKFDDSGFPLSSVDPGATWANENAAHGDDLYHNVFAHECRACHTQLHTAPAGSTTTPYPVADQFNTYADLESEFTTGGAHSISSLVLSKNVMPLARLTADRLWVNFGGGKSAATLLANRIQADAAASGLTDSSGNAVPPGTPSINASFAQAAPSNPVQTTPPGTGNSLTRFNQLRGDASPSSFMASYGWTLCLIPATGAGASGLDPNGTCSPIDALVSGSSATPAFAATKAGIYELTLSANSLATDGQALAAQPPYTFSVVRTDPQAPSCTLNVTLGNSASMSLASCQSGPSNPLVQGDDIPGTTDTLSLVSWSSPSHGYVASCDQTSSVSSCNNPSQTIYFSSLSQLGSSTLTYQLCDTADATGCATGAITVNVNAAPVPPTATATTYYVYLAPEHILNGVVSASPSATASQNGAPAENPPLAVRFQDPTNGIVLIPVDAATCSGNTLTPTAGSSTVPDSLVYAYGVTPCSDSFTLTFSNLATNGASVALPTPGGGNGTTGALAFTSAGQHSISATLTSTAPNCDYSGAYAAANGAACVPATSMNYKVNDTTSSQSSASSPAITVNFVETQSWGAATAPSQGTIYSYLTDSTNACHNCHTASTDLGGGYWNFASSAQSSLQTLKNGGSAGTVCTTGTACVNPGDPDTSNLALYACSVAHSTNSSFLSDQQCANLRQWIKEGANAY